MGNEQEIQAEITEISPTKAVIIEIMNNEDGENALKTMQEQLPEIYAAAIDYGEGVIQVAKQLDIDAHSEITNVRDSAIQIAEQRSENSWTRGLWATATSHIEQKHGIPIQTRPPTSNAPGVAMGNTALQSKQETEVSAKYDSYSRTVNIVTTAAQRYNTFQELYLKSQSANT